MELTTRSLLNAKSMSLIIIIGVIMQAMISYVCFISSNLGNQVTYYHHDVIQWGSIISFYPNYGRTDV
jgi:hypothetical protein